MKRTNPSTKKQPPTKRRRTQSTTQVVRKELRRLSDVKYTDSFSGAANMTTTGTFVSALANLARGDNGLDAFNGNVIFPHYYSLKYNVQTINIYNYCRVMVFQWMDATTPVLGGILQNTTASIATVSATLVTNKQYLRVLYDKTFCVAPTAGGDTTCIGNGVFSDTVFIPGNRIKKIRYNATTGFCQDGNIYLLFMSDDAVSTFPSITYYQRVAFFD